MTKREFKAAMLRGLGRCVQAVEQEPEKYRDLVLLAANSMPEDGFVLEEHLRETSRQEIQMTSAEKRFNR